MATGAHGGRSLRAVSAFPCHQPNGRRSVRVRGGRCPPRGQPERHGFIVGRRGGKSRIAALLAVYLAAFQNLHAGKGERATLPVIAADRKQARVVFGYVKGLLHGAPMLKALIEREGADSISLTNGVTIEVHTASWRSVRGYTVVGAVLDEVAVWRSMRARTPTRKSSLLYAPAMATVPGALLVAISSPYREERRSLGRVQEALRQDRRCPRVAGADARDESLRATAAHRCGHGGRRARCSRRVHGPSFVVTLRRS
jgi:hypothetical protein